MTNSVFIKLNLCINIAMFGNRKVIENNDYFIVTHKDIDFNFDKELCIDEEKVIEFGCTFGIKFYV